MRPGNLCSTWPLLELNRDLSIVNLARQTKGTADTVVKLNAVVLPEDAYIVEFDSRHVAGLAPANRQAAVRWLKEVSGRSQSKLTPYLERALQLTSKIDLVEALDMEDAIPPEAIRMKLKTSQVVSSAKPTVDVEKLVALLATLKGVTFEVVFKDDIHARFLLDFGQDAKELASLGKPLLLEVLNKHGASIEDFESWTPSVSGQQFVLTGKLSPSGMHKVFSLIDAPIAFFLAPSEPAKNDDPSKLMAYQSLAYFKSIQSILEDVRKESRDSVTLGQNAAWIDRWARKIDRLPILNVDNDMLDYGSKVVGHLRQASDSLKGVGMNTAYRSAYAGRSGGYGGYFGGYSADSDTGAIRTQEATQGASKALANCRDIESLNSTIRRIMTERYKIEF